jgi:hypothetical protein
MTPEVGVATNIDQGEALATAERLALQVLARLAPACTYAKVLTGNTKRGPAFLYGCGHCAAVTVVSVPAGGLRSRDPGDPTSRTRLATFALAALVIETGAFIESDGTVRALLALHLPGDPEPIWELTTDHAQAVGDATEALRALIARPASAAKLATVCPS